MSVRSCDFQAQPRHTTSPLWLPPPMKHRKKKKGKSITTYKKDCTLTTVPVESQVRHASMCPHRQPLPPLKKCKLVTHLGDCCSPYHTGTLRLHMPLSSATQGRTMTTMGPLPNDNDDSTRTVSENQQQQQQRGPHWTTTTMTTQQGQSAGTGKEEEAPTR